MTQCSSIQNIAAVVFDKDGVLADSEAINVKSLRDVFASHGYSFGPNVDREIVGRHPKDYFPAIARQFGLSKARQETMYAEKEALYARMWDEEGSLFDGVHEVLAHVRGRVSRLGIATSATRPELDAFLARFGLADFFELTLSRDEVDRPKPAPDIYLSAARAFGTDPRNILVVEDSEPGVTSAHAAGTFCIAVGGAHLAPGTLALADRTIADLRDLPALLGDLGRA
jgi:HAD superfamily hydrolase (TIGR01509 family)